MADCGGCRGLGSHQRYCPRHPDYHPWKILAARAEDIGDQIGSNEPGIANQAYRLSSLIKIAMKDHPWRGFSGDPPTAPADPEPRSPHE